MIERSSLPLRSAWRLALFLVALLAAAIVPAAAQPLQESERDAIVARAWLDDPDSSLSPQAALEREWTPFTGLLLRGFTASTTWLRLRIDPAAVPQAFAADRRVVLRIMPGQLDEVAVFRADRLSQPPVLVGDTYRLSGPQRGLLHHAVVVDDAEAPFELLMRLRTQSNHSLHVQALGWDEARDTTAAEHSLVIAYLVFTVMVIVSAAIFWMEYRDAVLGLFILHQGSVLLVSLVLLGVLRLYGPDGLMPALDRLTSIAIPVSVLVSVQFHGRLLADLGGRMGDLKVLRGSVVLPILALLLIALGWVRTGLQLTMVTITVVMTLLIIVALRARPHPAEAGAKGSGLRRAYPVAVYLAMAALTMPQTLRALGLAPAGMWTYRGFMAYGLASSLLLGSLLVVRGRDASRRRRHAELAFAQAQREAEAQRVRASEQADLMTMLTHELKTPLSVVSLALGSASRQPSMRERGLRAVGNMRDVIDRCAEVALVDDAVGRYGGPPALRPVSMEEVLADALGAQLQADRVDCAVARSVPACLGDRQMLRVIVSNLIENALKYSPPEGRVRVFVEPAVVEGLGGVALRVVNRVGAAGRPDADRIFEKYHRGARARNRSGSGLGLYLSRRLAYRLGGELSLRGGDADEVTFELWLPS